MRFSNQEVEQLLRAWFVISLAFAILLNDTEFSLSPAFFTGFFGEFVISAITVGLGFLLHELSHKFLAQRYGAIAEFRSFDTMLFVALAMSFFGFIFAAPGAVFIRGNINTARNGRISAAGPIVNIGLAFIFAFLYFAFSAFESNSLLLRLAEYGMYINAWLAVFNMLPFWQMDGIKIWRWNRQTYFILLGAALLMLMLPRLVIT